MISFKVGNFVQMSVNFILNSNKLKHSIAIVGKSIVCNKEDISMIKELLKRREINVKIA